ncbi:MAG TPA: [protein-PII] uridylyltransferase [Rudaea sp.]
MPASSEPIRFPRLPPAIPRSGVSSEARLALRQLLGDIDRRLADAFAEGADAALLVRERSRAVENLVTHVWGACVGDSAALALYAVGGFGRGELFPHSDVDLLALTQSPPQGASTRALESFFTCLWDVGLKPGHALRTLDECRALAATDASVYTSLLDGRRIAGTPLLDAGFAALLADEAIWPRADYLASKRADRDQRHARFDDTAYNLEPNLKDGPGGLRELQLIHWLGQRLFGASDRISLVARGLLSENEASAAESARALLTRIRFALHLVAGRAEERLLFDYQRTLAARFGFKDEHRHNLAVEQFMQGFYRTAISVERLTEQFVQRCEEALDAGDAPRAVRITIDFVAIGGRLDCDPPDLFLQRPAALIDLFRVWIEHPEIVGLRADCVRRVHEALDRNGADLPYDDDVNAAFARLLRKGAPAVEALARMNRLGVLAQYLPAFGKVVGRMQYDLFHVYTVDEHTLRVLRMVARFADPQASKGYELAHELWSRLPKPELLLLAALFHDIAKGRGGDHSELGEVEAREFCARLDLPASDIDLVAWLVRWHLIMSVTAQKQDISDPDVVHRFAVNVADWERLDYLYLLTVADISGTSAKLWNSWKDRLLCDLYVSARYMLRAGLERPPHAAERVRECQNHALAMLREQGIDADTASAIWADFPDESFLRLRAEQIAWQTAGIARARDRSAPLVLIEAQSARGGTEVFVHACDRDGLFAALTEVFDRLRLSVQDARVLTARNGMSLDTFLILDANGHALADAGQVARLQRALQQALAQSPYAPHEPAPRAPSRSLRHFPIAPRVEFSDDAASGTTKLALVCSDRPGLLATVAHILRVERVRVRDARIATFGERVEDFFELTDDRDHPLGAERRSALRAALLASIAPSTPTKEHHASA